MTLFQKVSAIHKRLGAPWHAYFEGLGIRKTSSTRKFFHSSTAAPKGAKIPSGFKDFGGGDKWKVIEPGRPSASLFFHALASPAVIVPNLPPHLYPSEEDLETVENFIFAEAKRSLADIRQMAEGAPLGLAVFTKQYRNASDTTHGRHADFVFSRTGVARIGNEGPDDASKLSQLQYDGVLRCFPVAGSKPANIRVLPCRYSAYIAARVKGRQDESIPGRFRPDDDKNEFWLPLHKLFDGDECLSDLPGLEIELSHVHINEKLRRIHRAIQILGHGSKYHEPEISRPPFVETNLLTAFVAHPDGGSALLIPKNKLVEQVKQNGQLITLTVFPSQENTDGSLRFYPRPLRWAPEFVHARTKVVPGGATQDLNLEADVTGIVRRGGYEAVHYRDFTGDGWVRALCPQLAQQISLSIAAYSIIAPPDLMPNLRQSDLTDWYDREAPADIKENLWNGSSPKPLCDVRRPPNLELPGGTFHASDTTALSLIGFQQTPREASETRVPQVENRTSALPDSASGIFAPGSDIGSDETPRMADSQGVPVPATKYLSNYGMGSPFLEDTKLCSAQSAFWPGTTPDTSRVFEPFSEQPTVTPLLDSELAWDDSPVPTIQSLPAAGNPGEVLHRSRAHTDYIVQFAKARFDLLHVLGVQEYVNRTIAMARVYQALGTMLTPARPQWVVLSCLKVNTKTLTADTLGAGQPPAPQPDTLIAPERIPAATARAEIQNFTNSMYRFVLYLKEGKRPGPAIGTFLVTFFEMVTLYANSNDVYVKRNGFWEHSRF